MIIQYLSLTSKIFWPFCISSQKSMLTGHIFRTGSLIYFALIHVKQIQKKNKSSNVHLGILL